MMENTRRQGASFLIYIIFGALIAAFVINFGPQSRGGSGCGGNAQSSYLTVGSNEVSLNSYRYAATMSNKDTPGALAALTRRELLAQAAEARGIRVSDAMVDEQLKAGNIYLGGQLLPQYKSALTDTVEGETFFNFAKLKGLAVNGFGMSVAQFKDQQRRELQAYLMEQVLRESVRAAREEARDEFIYEGSTVTFEAVTFASADYATAMQLTDADVARYVAANDAAVRAAYTADERSYKGTKPAVLVRQIFVAKAAAAAPPADGATPPADGAAATPPADGAAAAKAPAEAKPDPALASLQATRADILAKKTTFAAAAARLNQDPVDRANSGRLGYRTADAPKLPDATLNDAVKAMKVGDVSEVLTTSKGFWLLTVEDKREGDLSYDQVKDEIGAKLAREAWSKEGARAAALAALAAAREGTGKNLADLYEKAPVRQQPGGGMDDLLRLYTDPNTPQETRDMIEQLLQQQMGGGDITGSIQVPDGRYESGVILASSKAWPRALAEATPPADASAAAAGSGSATPAPTATPAAATTAAAVDVMAPVTAQLPTFGEITKPKVETVGPMPRTRGEVGPLGTSKPLVAALFDQLTEGQVADKIFAVDRGFVIVQLTAKGKPETETFDKEADERVRSLSRVRGQAFVRQWLTARCDKLVADKKLSASKQILRREEPDGKVTELPFAPCEF
jgi:parvulin-like peptidyl-prolyl isomerase